MTDLNRRTLLEITAQGLVLAGVAALPAAAWAQAAPKRGRGLY
jgi:hypothetical protein